jgi:hypothetical protein
MRAIELADWPDASAQDRAVQHVKSQLYGALPDSTLADVSLLNHFGGFLDAAQWHAHFVYDGNTPVPALRVCTDGTVEEITWQQECVVPNKYEERHVNVFLQGREIVAFWDTTATEPNPKACTMANTDGLKGDVMILLCIDDEQGFIKRKRFVPCTLDILCPPSTKRKAPADETEPAATLAQFKNASKRMAANFRSYEAYQSRDAVAPNTITPGTVMPAPSGAALAAVARMRGLGGGSPPSSARHARA